MVAHLAEGHLQLPTLDEPPDDLQRACAASVHSSACGSKRWSGSRSSTQRIGIAGIPARHQTAVPEWISTVRSASPYQPGTITRRHGVSSSASTAERVGRRGARDAQSVPEVAIERDAELAAGLHQAEQDVAGG